jgi:bifunctional non-homologous end joining protein LigD
VIIVAAPQRQLDHHRRPSGDLRPDGRSDFDKLHTHGYDDQVVLYAFDLIRVDGEDWRPRPLEEWKAKLAKLLRPLRHGICFSEHLNDDGELVFKHACLLGFEGIVSKRRDFPTARAGRNAGARSRTRRARPWCTFRKARFDR